MSDEYVEYGLRCITEADGSQRPQCIICNAKLDNSRLAPEKTKRAFPKAARRWVIQEHNAR